MARNFITMDENINAYMREVSVREPDVLRRLREETAKMDHAIMQISPVQGQFMALLVELLGARKALEVGTFTGYSALCVALALPADGMLVACDVSEDWTRVGRRYWKEAGVAGKIDLRIAPGLETLEILIAGGEAETFDIAFIDADKENYAAYYERALKLVRPGGLVLIDNVLWDGKVADPEEQKAETKAIRALNSKLHADERITLSMIPIGDGLTLARKRAQDRQEPAK